MTATTERPRTAAGAGTRASAERRGILPAWLHERGMGASVLVAALSSAFGVVLITATRYIDALLKNDPFIGGSITLAVVTSLLGALLLGIAIYVAAVVTANTFATIVAGRTRQIALMRLIGASARSQRAEVARQGLSVGVIGAVIGLVVGGALAWGGVTVLARVIGADVPFSAFSPLALIPAVAVALTTRAAAWSGSRRVLTVTPLEALAGSVERVAEDVRRPARSAVAVILLLAGAVLLAGGVVVGMVTPLGVVIAFFGGLASFTGLALGATFIMPPLLRLVGRMFGSSATAKLAAENAMRHPERSSRMAIGVVMGVTLVTMFQVASESAKAVLATSAGGEVDVSLAQLIDMFAYVMMALVGVSAVIAAVGLVNLLTIGVVQRRRELGLLRSLGFTARQVRRMVMLEAAHIAITSLITGLVLGIAYGWIGAQATLGSVRMPPEFTAPTVVAPSIPWGFVVAVIAATALLTVIASLVPTRLATRVAPVEALATD